MKWNKMTVLAQLRGHKYLVQRNRSRFNGSLTDICSKSSPKHSANKAAGRHNVCQTTHCGARQNRHLNLF